MQPEPFINSISYMLYTHRFNYGFQVGTIACGLSDEGEGFCASYDGIGATEFADFACVGTASDQLWGLCGSFYRENMEPEELVETVGQILLAGENRDAFSGWGCEVYLLTKDNLTIINYKPRQD